MKKLVTLYIARASCLRKYNNMLGSIIGDIVGSRFEFDNYRAKDFEFFTKACFPTDDTIMTLAICTALYNCKKDYTDLEKQCIVWMQALGRMYPDAGYGARFCSWIDSLDPKPYNSWGNGSAMRVSPVAYVAKSVEEVKELSYKVSCVTHNHPEGIKGAEATAVATYMALHGVSKTEIYNVITSDYYKLDFTLNEIRDTYEFNESCQETVPQALQAFFEADDFEDAIRNAISIGGDSDTLGAITGAIAGAYYGVPEDIAVQALSYLDKTEKAILEKFENNIQQ